MSIFVAEGADISPTILTEISRLEASEKASIAKIAHLEGANESLNNQVNTLTEKLASLETKGIEAKAQSENSELIALREELASLKAENETLQEKAKALQDENEKLATANKELANLTGKPVSVPKDEQAQIVSDKNVSREQKAMQAHRKALEALKSTPTKM